MDVAWVYVSTLLTSTEALTPAHPTGEVHAASPPPHPMGTNHQLQQYQRGTTLVSTWGATSQGHGDTFLTQAAKSGICLTCKDTELTATFDSLRKLQVLKWRNWVGWKLRFPPQNPIYRICCLKTSFFYSHIRQNQSIQQHINSSAAPQKAHMRLPQLPVA